jgi:hypothetical protein
MAQEKRGSPENGPAGRNVGASSIDSPARVGHPAPMNEHVLEPPAVTTYSADELVWIAACGTKTAS